jgi:hypothetical protein
VKNNIGNIYNKNFSSPFSYTPSGYEEKLNIKLLVNLGILFESGNLNDNEQITIDKKYTVINPKISTIAPMNNELGKILKFPTT